MPFSNETRAGGSGAQSTGFYNGIVEQSLRFDEKISFPEIVNFSAKIHRLSIKTLRFDE